MTENHDNEIQTNEIRTNEIQTNEIQTNEVQTNEIQTNEVQMSLKLMVVLSKAYKSIADQALKDIRSYGMSSSEFGILEVLYSKGKFPIQQIGGKILITSGTMTYNIDKLEGKGLIRRVPCAEDRRVVYAELTEEGKALFTRIFPKHSQRIHDKMSALTESQKLQAIELLKILGKGAQTNDNNTHD